MFLRFPLSKNKQREKLKKVIAKQLGENIQDNGASSRRINRQQTISALDNSADENQKSRANQRASTVSPNKRRGTVMQQNLFEQAQRFSRSAPTSPEAKRRSTFMNSNSASSPRKSINSARKSLKLNALVAPKSNSNQAYGAKIGAGLGAASLAPQRKDDAGHSSPKRGSVGFNV